MKRLITLFAVLLILLIAGCDDSASVTEPVNYYYPLVDTTYGTKDGLIRASVVEGFQIDTETLLQNYLSGNLDPAFRNPFPENVTLISFEQEELASKLVLSDEFSELNGIDLTVACVCLARTTLELTDSTSVTITCESGLIGGEETLTFQADQVLWLDSSTGPLPTQPAETGTKE